MLSAEYLVVAQRTEINGYKGIDPSLISQFKEGRREAIARQLLDEGVREYEFVTLQSIYREQKILQLLQYLALACEASILTKLQNLDRQD